jgi:hypothetical protein
MNNGHEESRLDRIESAMEALIRSQSHLLEAQTGLERDHKLLLQAQVLMQDQLTKFMAVSASNKEESDKRMQRVELNLAEATDKLNGLINLMDRHLDEHRRPEQ